MGVRRVKDESPRTTRVKDIILTQGLRILAEDGMASVTAVRIAEATGVARTTIYRHYPEPSSLLLAVVECAVRPHGSVETAGDLEQDLRAALVGLRERMRRKPFRVVFAAVLEQANRDEAFARAQRRLLDSMLEPVAAVLRQAQADGRLPPSVDVDVAVLGAASPLLTQHVMLRAPIEDRHIDSVVERFVGAVQGLSR